MQQILPMAAVKRAFDTYLSLLVKRLEESNYNLELEDKSEWKLFKNLFLKEYKRGANKVIDSTEITQS